MDSQGFRSEQTPQEVTRFLSEAFSPSRAYSAMLRPESRVLQDSKECVERVFGILLHEIDWVVLGGAGTLGKRVWVLKVFQVGKRVANAAEGIDAVENNVVLQVVAA